jgi:uncharacterized protein DUF5666
MKQRQWYAMAIVMVFGCGTGAAAQVSSSGTDENAQAVAPWLSHEISGIVKSIDAGGSQLTVETRSGRLVQVDASAAIQTNRVNIPPVGHAVKVQGTYDAKGVLQASLIQRAKDSSVGWSADR